MTKIDLNEASLRPALYAQRLLDRAESAETRVAQLEAVRDTAFSILRESQLHHTSIVLALYEIDEKVFGPLTCKEGIAELKQQRDAARAERDAARETIETIRSLVGAYPEHDTIEAVRRAMEFARYETARANALQAQLDNIKVGL